MNSDRGRWSHLVGGTAFLVESRGVNPYKDPFDKAMLEFQMAFIVSAPIANLIWSTHQYLFPMRQGW